MSTSSVSSSAATAAPASPAVSLLPTRASSAPLPGVAPLARVRARVWDSPLRVFHWGLVVAVAIAVATGKAGGEWMPTHGRAALAIIGLLVFRVMWGLVGPTTARFGHFLPTPARWRAYRAGRWHGVGHNPLGAVSVVVLLGLLAWQAGSGLFSDDDIAFTGPWAAWVSGDLSHWFTGWHRRLANAVLYWVGLHVAAIAFHTWVKKDALLPPMVTGWKVIDAAHVPPARGGGLPALVASIGVALGAVMAVLVVGLGASPAAVSAPAPAQTASAPAW